ncbi:unnamed protein product [Phytophthora fragariaefolia]|uniref:Unnamed protein product n=1 Tax=Phytophthora fragariaefolia TaxID=1490495 RepID=A0A9W6XBM5_9STRA|nr:unnamed protein product [Phytophthora fragariaefolia]
MDLDPGCRRGVDVLDLLPGESRGYWKQHSPGKWFRQAKSYGKINNEKAILLLDTGAEVSIVDTAFARKVGCYIDRSQSQECVGIGENVYTTEGRTRIKITLAGSLVYIFDIWVGDLSGQEAILGMDFMVPAGIRLDLADGSLCLPDEIRIQLSGRRQLSNDKVQLVKLDQHLQLGVGESAELPVRLRRSGHDKLWVTRGDLWVPTVVNGQVTPARVSEARRQSPAQRSGPDPDDMVTGERSLDPDPGDDQLKGDDNQYPDIATDDSLALLNSTADLGFSSETQDSERARNPAVGEETVLAVAVSGSNHSETGDGPAIPGAIGEKKTPDPADLRVLVDGQRQQVVDSHRERDQAPDPTDSLDPEPDDSTADEQVCYHESGDLHAEDVAAEMAVLPEVTSTTAEVTIEDIQVGDPDINTPEEIERLRRRIWERRHLLIGKGNALPSAARGVVCDIDVGNAKPIAQRVRKVAPQFRETLSDLIKGLLGAKIISISTSPWASPIVVIIKKNGVDIRLCIDYRLVKRIWTKYCGIVHLIWLVDSGLKNAPQIYQRILDSALYGFTRIPRPGSSGFDKDGSKLDGSGSDEVSTDQSQDESLYLIKPSVLGRRSYIDDILVTAGSWDHLCDRVEDLLDACDRWNLSISVVKSFWGKSKVEYLGHHVSSSGLEANPKDLAALTDLPFPQSLRSMQSFLGSLNYYSRFIEDYAIYAAVLYELREVDFAAMSKTENQTQIQARMARSTPDPDDPAPEQVDPRFDNLDPNSSGSVGVDLRWIRAHRAFDILKERIANTPILRHFDPDKLPVIVVYASTWAISAALMQGHAGVYHTVMFTSRTLKSNELKYGIQVLTRHSTLAWLFRSTGLQGRLGQWAALLSPWTLEIVKCKKGEVEILGVIAASITPRTEVDLALVAIAPKKEPRRQIQTPIPTVLPAARLYGASFDGSARVKRGGGAYSAILWELPEWTVVKARSGYAEGLTVNEAEYHALLLCLDLLEGEDQQRLIVYGDSNLVIRQVRGEIDCKAPGLTLLRQKALDRLRIWPDHDLVHVKRDWNGSADRLASAALQRQARIMVEDEADLRDLVTLNRLDEILKPETIQEWSVARVVPITTGSRAGPRLGGSESSGSRPGRPGSDGSRPAPEVLGEEIVRELRISRLRQAQDEESWISGLKTYLTGRIQRLTQDEVKSYSKISMDYDVDLNDLLYYCPPTRLIATD